MLEPVRHAPSRKAFTFDGAMHRAHAESDAFYTVFKTHGAWCLTDGCLDHIIMHLLPRSTLSLLDVRWTQAMIPLLTEFDHRPNTVPNLNPNLKPNGTVTLNSNPTLMK